MAVPGSSILAVMEGIEKACWQMSESAYESEALNTEELRKTWYIFNRVATPDTYPPVVSKDNADWLFVKLAKSMDKTWYVAYTLCIQFFDPVI